MRLTASFILLSALFVSAIALGQTVSPGFYRGGDEAASCNRGAGEWCWIARYGKCADEDPRMAIPACTRQLLDRESVQRVNAFTDQPDSNPQQAIIDRANRYALRATGYTKLGEFDKALLDYERAVRTKGDIAWIHAVRGSAQFSVAYEQEALASLNDAISLEPDNPFYLNARSRILSSSVDDNVRNGPRAIADAQRASELQPRQPAFVAVLATAYAENGEFERAVEIQQQAIDMLGPDNQDARERYMSRLALYREGMPFRREIACGAEEGSSDPDGDDVGATLAPYIVFCYDDGTARGSRVPDVR